MISIQRILLPTDFSEGAAHALIQAVPLAHWYEACLTILHVSSLEAATAGFPPMINPITLKPLSHERLIEELQRFALPASRAGVHVEFSTREGPAAGEILEQARSSAADLIVMGTHGRSGFERLMLGSVTEKVLHKAPCPVMTVAPMAAGAPPHSPTDLRHIVCPLDFSQASHEALRYALALAERSRARLTVLHVIEWTEAELRHSHGASPDHRRYVQEEARRQLHDAVPHDARDWCRIEERVLAGSPWKRILALATEEVPDLVVLGAHGHNALERFVFGSTTNQVVRQAPCPILSVRRPERPARAVDAKLEGRAAATSKPLSL